VALLESTRSNVGVGIATGRRLESVLKALKKCHVPAPDVYITSVGTEIHYAGRLVEDMGWRRHTEYHWQPDALHKAMNDFPGLRLQPPEEQRAHKISYFVDARQTPSVREITRHLRRLNLQARVVYSHEAYLDLIPVRASQGLALRFLSHKWGLPLQRFLVAGDSGNDEDMLTGNTLGVVVANYSPELAHLRGAPRIYFAERAYAGGIIEGIEHYDFLGDIRIPPDEEMPAEGEQSQETLAAT
jgi:sucrose-phosphate synthase